MEISLSFSFAVSVCDCDDMFACIIFSAIYTFTSLCVCLWVNYPCLLCIQSEYTRWWFLYVLMSMYCMYCVYVYIWLYVGRWQSFVFTTSVLAVCVCGFLQFTAASSAQPHCSSVFSLPRSDIVNIIKALFTKWISAHQLVSLTKF